MDEQKHTPTRTIPIQHRPSSHHHQEPFERIRESQSYSNQLDQNVDAYENSYKRRTKETREYVLEERRSASEEYLQRDSTKQNENENVIVYWPPLEAETSDALRKTPSTPRNIYDPENIEELRRQQRLEHEAMTKNREEALRQRKKHYQAYKIQEEMIDRHRNTTNPRKFHSGISLNVNTRDYGAEFAPLVVRFFGGKNFTIFFSGIFFIAYKHSNF